MTVASNKEFAASIRPAVNGQSDKFSWRLYKRALQRGRERVYISAWSVIWGDMVPNLEKLKAGDGEQRGLLMIGDEIGPDGWFHGKRLLEVTREGASLSNMAYGPQFNTKAWLDVTDWFWREYLARGRCIIHGDLVHEWVAINANARKCAYCGRHERRTVKTVRKVERCESWEAECP
jgi:hypothetical protein